MFACMYCLCMYVHHIEYTVQCMYIVHCPLGRKQIGMLLLKFSQFFGVWSFK